jgi:hypothetical protein
MYLTFGCLSNPTAPIREWRGKRVYTTYKRVRCNFKKIRKNKFTLLASLRNIYIDIIILALPSAGRGLPLPSRNCMSFFLTHSLLSSSSVSAEGVFIIVVIIIRSASAASKHVEEKFAPSFIGPSTPSSSASAAATGAPGEPGEVVLAVLAVRIAVVTDAFSEAGASMAMVAINRRRVAQEKKQKDRENENCKLECALVM